MQSETINTPGFVATDLEGISQIYHELSLYRENKKTAKKHLTKAVVRSLAANP